MPHLTMEYSANLAERLDLPAVTKVARDAMLETGLFELGAIRVRAIACAAYAIADMTPDNAFLDMTLRMGAGRSAADKKRAGDAIYAAVSRTVADLLATPHFALSFEIREIDPQLSWKTNAMHARLRSSAS